jgi:hypothetical protein
MLLPYRHVVGEPQSGSLELFLPGTVLYKCTTSINAGSSPTRTRSRTHPPRSVGCRLGQPGCCRCHALVQYASQSI